MIQISFQSSLDPYHTIFRLLRLMPLIEFAGKLEHDHVRIIDFYLAFPFRISSIRLKQEHRTFRKIIKLFEKDKPYGEMPEDQDFFNRMRPIQLTAFQHLTACDLIDPKQFDDGWIAPTGGAIPEELGRRVDDANKQDEQLMGVLKLLALDYPLSGVGGLKERTHLLEHRYDAA